MREVLGMVGCALLTYLEETMKDAQEDTAEPESVGSLVDPCCRARCKVEELDSIRLIGLLSCKTHNASE